jgi:hypothetical protein
MKKSELIKIIKEEVESTLSAMGPLSRKKNFPAIVKDTEGAIARGHGVAISDEDFDSEENQKLFRAIEDDLQSQDALLVKRGRLALSAFYGGRNPNNPKSAKEIFSATY